MPRKTSQSSKSQEKPSLQISKQKLKQFGNVVPPLNINKGQLKVNTAGKSQQIMRA